MLDIVSREVRPPNKNIDDGHVKRFVRSVSVKFKTGPGKTLEVGRAAVNVVYNSSSGFSGPSNGVPVVEDEIFKQDAPYNLRNLTSRNDHAPSAWQHIKALWRDNGLFVPSHVSDVQGLIKDALAALGSSEDSPELLVEHTKVCEARKFNLEASLKASNSKRSDAQQRVEEPELSKNTVEPLQTEVDEAEKALAASQERVQYLEN